MSTYRELLTAKSPPHSDPHMAKMTPISARENVKPPLKPGDLFSCRRPTSPSFPGNLRGRSGLYRPPDDR